MSKVTELPDEESVPDPVELPDGHDGSDIEEANYASPDEFPEGVDG